MTDKPSIKDDAESAPSLEDEDEAPAPERDEPPLIVGLGASAGGLEALSQFCDALPAESDAAFVIIQHLDPTHESLMPELLSRHTKLAVQQVRERVPVKSNTIYIIPPGKYLALTDGHLELQDPPTQRLQRAPIDHFFQTLADIQRQRAVCIVLSGTGTDGTLGLRAVKTAGGLALVQSQESAQHDGMPRSAIATGAVDRVVSPAEMAAVITQYAKHPYVSGNPGKTGAKKKGSDYNAILTLLHARTGHQFGCYKNSTLHRRIHRRMSLHQVESPGEYLRLLRGDSHEVDELFRDLLIGVTSFFREPGAWHLLEERVLSEMVRRAAEEGRDLRVWAPGCATGEEAYTTAMLLDEAVGRVQREVAVHIFATDIDKDAFERARAGIYPASIASEVDDERLEKYFNKFDDHYEVKKRLREQVVFAPQSLIHDPPFSRLDMVICRNVMIYLESDVQKKLIKLFHFALRENGVLFLGPSETTGAKQDLFKTISKKWRIYRKAGMSQPGAVDMPILAGTVSKDSGQPPRIERVSRRHSFQSIAHEVLVNEFAPAAVLVNRDFDILYHHGPRHEYLHLPQGEPTDNVLDQARPGLRQKLRSLLTRAAETGERVDAEDGRVKCDDGAYRHVRISVIPLRYPREAEGTILISFHACEPKAEPVPAAPPRSESDENELSQLEYELKATREELQSTIEELETSNEELKASNEEIMSMNEELQSTNEELETSKEELQSLNEELTTVNNELQEKIQQLENTNDDLGNLLTSTSIATLFLDRDLCIKRFTPATTELMHLMPSDLGRPITHIAHRFQDEHLVSDAREVLDTLAPCQKEVRNDENHWFIRRIMPYRTKDDRIDGLVITFVEVTVQKLAEASIRDSEHRVRRIIDNQLAFVAVLDPDGTLQDVNEPALIRGGLSREQVVGKKFWDCYWCSYDSEIKSRIRRDVEQVSGGEVIRRDEVFRTEDDGRLIVDFMMTPVRDESGKVIQLIPSGVDVSERKLAEEELASREAQFKQAITNSPLPGLLYAEDGEVIMLSNAWTRITGYTLEDVPTIQDWIKHAYAEHAEEIIAQLGPIFEEEQHIENREHTIRCKNGERRVWRFSSSPLGRLRDGRRLRITKAMDVTELRAAYDRLEELNRTLEQKVTERTVELENSTERLRHLAHELTQAEQRERRRLASTLHDNLQQLLAVARLQIGQVAHMQPDRAAETIDKIKDTLDEAAQACRHLTTELAPTVLYDAGLVAALRWLCGWVGDRYNLEVDCDVKQELTPATQDIAVLLFQSVRELLFNVHKHAETNRATITIDATEDNWIRISVSDAGRGFNPEGQVVQPDKGSGFGLFSIRERITVLGGRVEFNSDTAEGTRIVLVAPAKRVESDAPDQAPAEPDPKITPPTRDRPIRVLLVDDHVLVRKGLAQLMTMEADFELVGEASDGHEAVAMAHKQRPHVVVMDVNMPKMNGIEATRQLTRDMPGLHVIGLSVQTDPGTRDSILDAGAVGLVAKGGPPDELWDLIRSSIRRNGD